MVDVKDTSRPVTDQIKELESKIQLLDGDQKAYYETSQWNMKQNQETILLRRKENQELHKKLSDCLTADDHVINKAFADKQTERSSLKNKTATAAISIVDGKLMDHEKRLNALRHRTAVRQAKLDGLLQRKAEQENAMAEREKTEAGISAAGERLRDLENRLDKAHLKTNEAEHIKRTYAQIFTKLQEDSMNYPNALDKLEQEIRKCQKDSAELRAMNKEAELCKERALGDLKTHEEIVYAERKKREGELQQTKKEADERKRQHERIERRLQRTGSFTEELTMVQNDGTHSPDADDEKERFSVFEDKFRKLKEVTGVVDTQSVVERFEKQGETTKRLEDKSEEQENQIKRLREETEALRKKFQEMKYTGEAKLSTGQSILEEYRSYVSEKKVKRDQSCAQLEQNSNIMVNIKLGVEHLAEKLQHLKAETEDLEAEVDEGVEMDDAVDDQEEAGAKDEEAVAEVGDEETKSHVPVVQLSSESNEYVLDLLSQCEEKLLKVMESLENKDLAQLQAQMEQEDFHSKFENKLPQQNRRISLPESSREPMYEDEDDSGDEAGGGELPTRAQMKRDAELVIENKSKRKGGKQQKGKRK